MNRQEHGDIRLIPMIGGVVLGLLEVNDGVGLGGPQCACSEGMNRLAKGRKRRSSREGATNELGVVAHPIEGASEDAASQLIAVAG